MTRLRPARPYSRPLTWGSLFTVLCALPAFADPAPAFLVKDIRSDSGTPGRAGFGVSLANVAYFHAWTAATGSEPWRSDGTAAGTVLVRDIQSAANSGIPLNSGIDLQSPLTAANGRIFFAAFTTTFGRELWTSDGTAAGTVRVKDIRPGTFLSSNPEGITNLGGTLFFAANDGTTGTELWKSDGTDAGTQLVKDIYPGFTSGTPGELTEHAGVLYFRAIGDSGGDELWRSDGTAAGTVPVKDIVPGSQGSAPAELLSWNGALYFRASTPANGSELWKSDGTDTGTAMVRDIAAGTGSSTPSSLRALAGRLVFRANDGAQGQELWTSDGSAEGTHRIDVWMGSGSGLAPSAFASPRDFVTVDGQLVFAANDGVRGTELWVSDGTAPGTRLLSDVAANGGSEPGEIVAAGDLVFFSANQPDPGRELFALPRAALDPISTVRVGSCESGVPNDHVFPNGTNFNVLIGECVASARNHGALTSCVAHLTSSWTNDGLIDNREQSAIMQCAAHAAKR